MTSLALNELTIIRGQRILTEALSARFPAGSLVEVTGHNGAGKTSLLRTIAGLSRPANGNIEIGKTTDAEERSGLVHLLGHRDGLKGPLTPTAHLTFWADILGANKQALPEALERVGLKSFADLPARVLSQGQSRRLALARLLVARRPVWLLDEPGAGLDKAGKALLNHLITEHLNDGGLVVAAVHEALGPSAQNLSLGAP